MSGAPVGRNLGPAPLRPAHTIAVGDQIRVTQGLIQSLIRAVQGGRDAVFIEAIEREGPGVVRIIVADAGGDTWPGERSMDLPMRGE